MAANLFVGTVSSGMRYLASLTGVTEVDVCSNNLYDCGYLQTLDKLPSGTTSCAPYDGQYKSVEGNWGLLVFTFIGMAVMAFSIGANDAANAWATSVHSFAIKLSTACILGGFLEALGATTLGYGVSTSLQRGISDYKKADCFACGRCDSHMTQYYVGMMSSLYGAGAFVLIASFFKMPVSTTHSIVGAVIGMTVVAVGFDCLNWGWNNLTGIIASWGISPIASGIICLIVYYTTDFLIFRSSAPRRNALIALPVLYFLVVFWVVYLSLSKAPGAKSLEQYWGPVGGAIAGTVAAILVIFLLLPHVRKNLPSVNPANKLNAENLTKFFSHPEGSTNKEKDGKTTLTEVPAEVPMATPEPQVHTPGKSPIADLRGDNGLYADMDPDRASIQVLNEYEALSEQQEDAMWLFKYLIVVAASLDAYAHGSNDTANATAAFSAVINGFKDGLYNCGSPESSWWIMLVGGLFLALGIWVLGYRVMATLGKDITLFNYHRGFCTEVASAITVVIASLLKLPVSSTHCQVGAVVFIGIAHYGVKKVQWKLLLGIVATWVFTVPSAALFSAFISWLVQYAFRA